MKISESWLREWVAFDADTQALAQRLTQSGLEVDSISPAAGDFAQVAVGRIVSLEGHPDADKLSVCQVDVGRGEQLQIVCGAGNVYAGMYAPVALVGAKLPDGMKIKKTRLRGVESRGMLCSARELGFGDDHSGILDLQGSGEPGDDLRALLALDDQVIDVDLTPNRGDCLGMEGIAREVAAAFKVDFRSLSVPIVKADNDQRLVVEILSPDSCPRYAGRIIRNIDCNAITPLWMRERLRRAGIRPVHTVVDVTNYVMIELGQPMHAFDLSTLSGGIKVRRANEGEVLTLLDGQEVALDSTVTVIADHDQALAIAGVMGGEGSGVQPDTADLFLESAYFDPRALAGVARSFGLHTDASHRFERGVDPTLQERAIERATQLLQEITGGEAGPVVLAESRGDLPQRSEVRLRKARLALLLGTDIPAEEVEEILARLGMPAKLEQGAWTVAAPTYRFDIQIEEDLVEEIARIHGYDQVPEVPGSATLRIQPRSEERVPISRLKDLLVARGYNEAVTYSFVDPDLQSMLSPDITAIALDNPIASNLSHMRVSLWPGLLTALQTNVSHRQARIRLFEYGMRFIPQGHDIKQDYVFSGLISGRRYPEQWSAGNERVDFYDLKGDVESLLALSGARANFMFNGDPHRALHPGRCAAIALQGRTVGWFGELHPEIAARLELVEVPQLFEIELDALTLAKLPEITAISRFPEIRRDIAMLIPEAITAAEIEAAVLSDKPATLQSLLIFDVYRGDNIDSGLKSVALGLILQDSSRTLTDKDADAVVADVTARLKKNLRASIRG